MNVRLITLVVVIGKVTTDINSKRIIYYYSHMFSLSTREVIFLMEAS